MLLCQYFRLVLHSNEAVSGEKIFSFSNMKRKIGMIEKAAEIQNQIPKTPARLRTQLTKGLNYKDATKT